MPAGARCITSTRVAPFTLEGRGSAPTPKGRSTPDRRVCPAHDQTSEKARFEAFRSLLYSFSTRNGWGHPMPS